MTVRRALAAAALGVASIATVGQAAVSEQVEAARMNPIRKVVTLLQSMQQKVTAEGEKEQELYDKFMCYCKTNGGELDASIAAAETKIPQLGSDIQAAEENKVQTEEALKQAQVDRSAAKEAMAEATAVREKEAAEFAKTKTELDTNIAAVQKAVAALEKGMAGGFLQTMAAQVLKRAMADSHGLSEDDRETVTSFLSGSASYAPSSGQITGILKELGDEMSASLADATKAENAAIQSFEELMAAKKKEVAALSESIEAKMAKIGELGVSIAQMKNDLTDTEEALLADQKFAAELSQGCKTKTAEWEERKKTRAEELVALADTIKILNDDDALDLFKKTLPSASASFVEVSSRASSLRARALEAVASAQQRAAALPAGRAGLDLIALALRGKKVGFEKVIAMIDKMCDTLKTEQQDDDHKKEYCVTQIDQTEDSKKALERKISDHETAIESAQEAISSLAEEIKQLEAGIKSLDKSVADATENRKEEHEEFMQLMASNSAAKEVLNFAKNRLNKFYNPKMYKAPPKKELSAGDRIAENMAFVQISRHSSSKEAPPPPPETFSGTYAKKSEENSGVMEMISLLIKDLDKEMTEAETEERNSQADYESMMSDSASKRASDSKALTGKQASKAEMEGQLESHTEGKAATVKEHMATGAYLQSLHSECDWLMQYYDVRKEARASEVDSLQKAKAVLSGADFSLVQTKSRGFLGRA